MLQLERMKGSVMDAMSDAVEGAEVMLYGVSNECEHRAQVLSLLHHSDQKSLGSDKESANCRLEANYAHQQDVDMIPL